MGICGGWGLREAVLISPPADSLHWGRLLTFVLDSLILHVLPSRPFSCYSAPAANHEHQVCSYNREAFRSGSKRCVRYGVAAPFSTGRCRGGARGTLSGAGVSSGESSCHPRTTPPPPPPPPRYYSTTTTT